MQLSDHFSLEELCKSQEAVRRGIDNKPSNTAEGQVVIGSLTALCRNILEPVRSHFDTPFAPSSGYRCLELNRALGSKDTSQHIKGQAADFEVPRVSNHDLAEWIRANLTFDQLILEHYESGQPSSGWVHCSFVEGRNRSDLLTINSNGTSVGLIV